jgi:hypothetical protein
MSRIIAISMKASEEAGNRSSSHSNGGTNATSRKSAPLSTASEAEQILKHPLVAKPPLESNERYRRPTAESPLQRSHHRPKGEPVEEPDGVLGQELKAIGWLLGVRAHWRQRLAAQSTIPTSQLG